MRQFVLPDYWNGSSRLELIGQDAKRINSVLRLSSGQSFPAIDRNGKKYQCNIISSERTCVVLDVITLSSDDSCDVYKPDIRNGKSSTVEDVDYSFVDEMLNENQTKIILAVGLLKGSKLDDVVRIATESGVYRIIPLVTDHSIPKEQAEGRIKRLERVIIEAKGQSGSETPTELMPAMTINQLLEQFPLKENKRVGIIFHEKPIAHASIHLYCTNVKDEIIACVGPEGGFSDSEVKLLMENGYGPAWLGKNVLRAETAAIFAISSIKMICLERFSWTEKRLSE